MFSDQQRWDTIGCYAPDAARLGVTPNLDAMAAEGIRFDSAFTCQPVCGPARACIQTGKWATETGCFKNNIALPLDEKTLAHWLAEAGYEVGYLGKWHLASDEQHNHRTTSVPPERRGGYKDYWLASDVLEFASHGYDGYLHDGDGKKVEFTGYRVDCLTDFALDYLRTRSGERPFFLFLSYIEPHHQNDRNRYEGPDGSKERFADFTPPRDLAEADTPGDWRENYPDYLGCIHSLDENLGRIRGLLAERGLADNTLVIYTSDHGSHFRTRNAEYKRSCHESSIRIPMIACGPGFRGGRTLDHLVSLIDLPPTVLAAAGATPPPTMRGRPLRTILHDPGAEWRSEVFVQISESQIGRAIRTRRWKYSVAVLCDEPWSGAKRPASGVYTEQCLYDLAADPHELNNLVRDPACDDIRAKLAETLKRRMAEAGEQVPRIDPAP
jgi:uncharacterized sulfatase